MKKVISLALCLMMLLSFMAINTNAAIPAHYPKTVDIFVRNFDGGEDESTSSQMTTGSTTAGDTCGVAEVDGNNVMEFKFDGSAYDSSTTKYAWTTAHEDGFLSTVSGVGTKYTFTFDLYPVCNASGLSFVFSNLEGIHIYPSAFIEGMWNTVKVDVDNGVKNYYVKLTDADDSTYTKLVLGTDCYKTGGFGSAATFYIGIDTRYMNVAAVDTATLFDAHYYLDNAVVTKYYPNQRNVVYTNTESAITSVGGAETYLRQTGINHSDLHNYFSVTFDAVRTGGDQPISFVLGAKGVTKTSSFHIINTGLRDVKYTYKFNVNQGLSGWQMPPVSAWRKAEGETQWTELTTGTDFYNISHSNNNDSMGLFRLQYYADSDKYPGNTTVDANTVWTVDNIQVTNSLDVAITGAFEQTETGIVGELGITKTGGNYTAIVAFYDGDAFKGAAAADISVEGTVDVSLETDSKAETLTVRVFLLDSMGTLIPIRDVMNVSDWVVE